MALNGFPLAQRQAHSSSVSSGLDLRSSGKEPLNTVETWLVVLGANGKLISGPKLRLSVSRLFFLLLLSGCLMFFYWFSPWVSAVELVSLR